MGPVKGISCNVLNANTADFKVWENYESVTISRTTGPNMGLFVLMFMHFQNDSKYGHAI